MANNPSPIERVMRHCPGKPKMGSGKHQASTFPAQSNAARKPSIVSRASSRWVIQDVSRNCRCRCAAYVKTEQLSEYAAGIFTVCSRPQRTSGSNVRLS